MGRTPYPLAPGESNELYRVRMHAEERELFVALNARERGAVIRRGLGLPELPVLPVRARRPRTRKA